MRGFQGRETVAGAGECAAAKKKITPKKQAEEEQKE
jgi:hypothetical protein